MLVGNITTHISLANFYNIGFISPILISFIVEDSI